MHVETRYFLVFQNILGIKKFRNRTNFFSGSPKYYFLQKVRYIQWNDLNVPLSSLALNIFSKNSWFLFLDKFQVQKGVDVITCFFCTVKKQKFRSIQTHSWNRQDSCCEYMVGDVNIYLYGCVSLSVPECAGYLSMYVCKTQIKVVLVLRY